MNSSITKVETTTLNVSVIQSVKSKLYLSVLLFVRGLRQL